MCKKRQLLYQNYILEKIFFKLKILDNNNKNNIYLCSIFFLIITKKKKYKIT